MLKISWQVLCNINLFLLSHHCEYLNLSLCVQLQQIPEHDEPDRHHLIAAAFYPFTCLRFGQQSEMIWTRYSTDKVQYMATCTKTYYCLIRSMLHSICNSILRIVGYSKQWNALRNYCYNSCLVFANKYGFFFLLTDNLMIWNNSLSLLYLTELALNRSKLLLYTVLLVLITMCTTKCLDLDVTYLVVKWN